LGVVDIFASSAKGSFGVLDILALSAKGAKYNSQGQARSASPLVNYKKEPPRPERPK